MRKHYLRKWLKSPSLQDFNIRAVSEVSLQMALHLGQGLNLLEAQPGLHVFTKQGVRVGVLLGCLILCLGALLLGFLHCSRSALFPDPGLGLLH